MKKHCLLVFFVLLAFGFCFANPAQDLPETAYDESEAVPYEASPIMSGNMGADKALAATAPVGAEESTSESNDPGLDFRELRPPQSICGLRVVLTLFCSFLC